MAAIDHSSFLVDQLETAINEHDTKIQSIDTEKTGELMKFQVLAQKMNQRVQFTVNVLENIKECNLSVIRALKSH